MEIGIDIQKIDAFKDFEENKKFYEKVFSEREIEYCMKREGYKSCFCGKFCVKEAVIKALNKKVSFSNIEVLNSESGKPYVEIDSCRRNDFNVSLSHSGDVCVGVAIKV